MEYAIAAGVTAVFIALYVVLRPRPREAFDATLKENELVSAAKEFAASLPPPSDGGGNAPAQPYARYVKRALRAKSPDPLISRIFEMLGEKREELKKLASEDFAPLQDLPCVNGKVRCVCVAETVLGHSKYIFCRERAEGVIKAFNEVRALTFAETDAMEKAFRYVLLKKLGFLCKNACLAERLRARALLTASHPRLFSYAAARFMKSTLFCRFCAEEMGYGTKNFQRKSDAVLDRIAEYVSNVLDSLENVAVFDFSEFYAPAEILKHFETYASATPEERAAFAKKLGELGERENLDEYAYAVRLENYGEFGTLPPFKVARTPLGKGSIVIAKFDADLLMLARALSSPVFMQMLFGEGEGKCILKKSKIKNSYLPKNRTFGAEIALSSDGGVLTLPRELPENVESAEFVLTADGVRHRVRIERGEPGLSVNGTVMKGVPAVKLGDIPLFVEVKVPPRGVE